MTFLVKSSVLSVAALLSCGLAHAASPGAYFGAGLGASNLGDIEFFTQDEDRQFGGRAFIGFNFNNYLGVEANYNILGSSRYTYYNNAFYDNSHFQIDYSLNTISLVGKAYIPLAENSWNLYGLLGAAQAQGKWKLLQGTRNTLLDRSPNSLVATAGLGVNIELNSKFTTAFEISAYGKKDDENGFDFIPGSALGTLSLSFKV